MRMAAGQAHRRLRRLAGEGDGVKAIPHQLRTALNADVAKRESMAPRLKDFVSTRKGKPRAKRPRPAANRHASPRHRPRQAPNGNYENE
jgi:hypothetical protein